MILPMFYKSLVLELWSEHTVLPRFTRLPWQIKNRVNQNSRYTSHSMDKIIVKKCQKNFYKALYIVLIEIFLDKIKKPCNRKPRNGKPRKTRDYCSISSL